MSYTIKYLKNYENNFSQYQTGFRKSFNAQNYLLVMTEKFKKTLDEMVEYAVSC